MPPFNPPTCYFMVRLLFGISDIVFKKTASSKILRCILTHINNPSSRLNFILRFGSGNTRRKDIT